MTNDIFHKLKTMRQTLHANPEISGFEFETQKRIIDFLEKETKANIKKIANTGVLAIFDSGLSGPVIMIRGDIDALPITEINTFAHRSNTPGTSHKCGHDGHTTILLGLAVELSNEPINKGKVILLFQPAEEIGMGADAVIHDAEFKKENIDFVFALHNLPGYALHEIVVKENEFTANVTSIIVKLNGKTSHAAEPEKGINPGFAIAKILEYADTITYNKPESKNFFLMTPIHVNMGELAYGISAGYGEVHITIRSWSTALMQEKNAAFVTFIQQLCKEQHLEVEISWTQVYHANVNNLEAVNAIRNSAKLNQFKLTERDFPFKWGEDFGLFTQIYKGAMFGIGSGINTPALHNPDYDFPDEIINTGVQMFHKIIQLNL